MTRSPITDDKCFIKIAFNYFYVRKIKLLKLFFATEATSGAPSIVMIVPHRDWRRKDKMW
jgi:hypothetical protein